MNWTDEMVEKAITELLASDFTTDESLEQISLYFEEQPITSKAQEILEQIEKEHS